MKQNKTVYNKSTNSISQVQVIMPPNIFTKLLLSAFNIIIIKCMVKVVQKVIQTQPINR